MNTPLEDAVKIIRRRHGISQVVSEQLHNILRFRPDYQGLQRSQIFARIEREYVFKDGGFMKREGMEG